MAASSTVLLSIEGFFLATIRAWQHSAVKRTLVDRTIAPLEAWQQVRLIGWVIVVATITRALLSLSAPWEGWRGPVGWTVVVTIGLGLIVGCRPVAVAWRHWRSR